jgi:guanylate kinase
MHRKGILVILSGPAGVGKGTILKKIMSSYDDLIYSISATTRVPRNGELDGVNYFFKSIDEFEKMIENDELIEWVKYVDNYYGTPKSFVEEKLSSGKDIVLEIDVEGAINIKRIYPDALMLFILPPSFEELNRRIIGRATESNQIIERRMEKAKLELSLVKYYDYAVVNDTVENSANAIITILKAEKYKVSRNNTYRC